MQCSEAAGKDAVDLMVWPDFVSAEEEMILLQETEWALRGKDISMIIGIGWVNYIIFIPSP